MQEVKEQVFNYINVLARPLVLKNSKKIGWTSLYAHKTVCLNFIYLYLKIFGAGSASEDRYFETYK